MRLLKHLIKVHSSYRTINCSNTSGLFISRQLHVLPNYDLDITINGVSVNKYVNKLEDVYHTLKHTSQDHKVLIEIEPAIQILGERKKLVDMLTNLHELLNDEDKEMQKIAEDEKKCFIDKINIIDKQLEEALLNIGSNDDHNAILLEINAGVGGQEAMLFANELFNMYCGFVEYKGWNYELAEYLTTDMGGIRHGSILINGQGVFNYLQHEAGVHRVQRIPSTEKSGRIHTSTASVLALPQPNDIEIKLDSKDLRIETKRASGAGGQHVNTTDSAVRITHLPTGLSVECQVDRSQLKNRELAMQRLRAKLYDLQLQKQEDEMLRRKKSQVRSNFRNEKIRTYNFSQDRITDHRLQNANIHNLIYFMKGNEMLENLINKLHQKYKRDNLLNILDEIIK